MTAIIESFFICLIASMIWAPAVFLAASHMHDDETPGVADKLWPTALLIAALPAMLAPFAAAFGLSLRNPAPLPPMAEPIATTNFEPAVRVTETVAPIVHPVSLADVLNAAAGLYFYGFVLFFALGAVRLVWFSYRVGYAFDVDEPRLEAGLNEWRERIGIKSAPRYAFTDAVSSVCVHGFFRPVILMPMHLLDRVSIDDAVLMGAHEMAHIKRGDTWLFAFASVMKAVFWFNPFIHRIAARANLAAEQAADALVIRSGASRKRYAKCFVEGLRFAVGAAGPEYDLVPSFTPFDKRSRRERLDAILSGTSSAPFLTMANKAGLGFSILLAAGLAFAQAALAATPKPPKEALPVAPIEGEVTITMGYGEKNPVLGKARPSHEGVDIRAPRGTEVHAAGAGKVIDATGRYNGSTAWGNVVVIDHGHGLVTRYAHLDRYDVKKGDHVDAGDIIGKVGSTGKATGPHLHFEVLQDGATIDPTPVVAVAPEPAPVKKASERTFRTVKVAPAPKIASAPTPLISKVRVITPEELEVPENVELDEKLERRLEGKMNKKLARLDEKLREQMKNYEDFFKSQDMQFEFGDMEFEGLDEFVDEMGKMDFHFEMPKFVNFYSEDMTDEQREEIERAHEEAMKEAERAMERAAADLERAAEVREEAIERARERMEERQAEMAERRAETEREFERQRSQMERQREAAIEQAERARERAMEERSRNREEHLAEKERALEQAQADLERQMEALERQQDELEAQRERLYEAFEEEDEDENWDD